MRKLAAFIGLAGFLLAAAVPAARAALLLRNDKVAVTSETLAPGRQEQLDGAHANVLVVLSGDAIRVVAAGGQAKTLSVKRGDTLNQPAGVRSIANVGRTEVQLVRTEFLTDGSGITWGAVGLPPNYRLLFEDRYSRTYDIRIAAHQWEQQHTHHARVVVCLSGAQLEHVLPDGSVQPSTLKTGEVAWRQGQTHKGHNLGSTDLWVIAIEPK